MKVSVIIPNFNGAELLKKNLPKVLAAGADEVIVVDDASSDDSVQVVKRFSQVKLIKNQKNLGFVNSVNRGVNRSIGDVVVLLNTDVTPEKNFLKPVLPYFKNNKIFAVTFTEPQFSWASASFVDGFIVHHPGPRQNTPHISFWASGGSAAFAKDKWQKLGGMDPIYGPFYWEDIDISYRAQKRGWETWWEPQSVVVHEHGATIDKYFNKNFKDYIATRNQLIFIWKNITDPKLFNQHRASLLRKLAKGQMWRTFLATLTKTWPILEKRGKEKIKAKISDEEIFKKFI